MRTAIGFDRHVLERKAGSAVMVAGVSVPCDFSVVAHSDGDVVYHSLADAICSVCLHTSIGQMFGDTDDRWRGCDSSFFLKETYRKAGCPKMENIDIVVISDGVMVSQFAGRMAGNICELLGLEPDRVSIRGRRFENDGSVIECLASILFS